MADFFFFHNTQTCIGCCACQVACKDKNHLLPGEFFRRVVLLRLPDVSKPHFYSVSCGHCENAVCISACPNGAFFRTEDGTVLHEDGKCIGCGKCLWSCPFGAISMSAQKGVAQKCDGCLDFRRNGLMPACVGACVNGSLQFSSTNGVIGTDRSLGGNLPAKTKPRNRVYWKGVTDRCKEL